jgi:hypothetical protein
MSRDLFWRCLASYTGTLSIKLLGKFVILTGLDGDLSLCEMSYFLPYVLNRLIHLFLLGILLVNLEMNILYENSMLQDLLQICKFIGDIIM